MIPTKETDAAVPPADGPSKRKTWAFGLVLALFSVAVAGSELLYRAYRRFYAPRKLALVRENPHGTGSYRLLPSLDVTTRVEGRKVRLRTNALGMPWREVDLAKPPNARRVAFVGDSFTFGLWADSWERSFVGVFDSILSRRGFEVMNFGTPGYGLDDMALQIREDVLPSHPDYLVLVFNDGNDFGDTWLGTGKYRVWKGRLVNTSLMKEKVPAEYRKKRPSEKRAIGPGERIRSMFRRHLALVRILSRREAPRPSREFRVNPKFLSHTFWSQVPYPPIAEEARDLSLREMGEIEDLCRRNSVTLLIVAMPSAQQVYATKEQGPGYDIYLPQRVVEEFARQRGIAYLDLLPVARRRLAETGEPLFARRDAHLNNEGHALIGRAVAAWFEGIADRAGERPEPAGSTVSRPSDGEDAERRPGA